MAISRTKEDILSKALGKYTGLGFWLAETDDLITELYYGCHCITRFDQRIVTIKVLQDTCQNYLDTTISKVEEN